MNPVYWLERRMRAREKKLWAIALFFVFSLSVIAGLIVSGTMTGEWQETAAPASLGSDLLNSILFCQAGLLNILAPLAAASRISQEKEQRTQAALMNSPLSPAQIAWGKLKGAWLFVGWLAMYALPFLALAYLWGGYPMSVLLTGFTLNLLSGLTLSALALGLSGLFGRSLSAYMAVGATLFGWMVIVPLLGVLITAFSKEAGFADEIGYLAWYHNPFFPLSLMLSTDWAIEEGETLLRAGYGVFIWFLVGLAGFGLAVRSLKRELF